MKTDENLKEAFSGECQAYRKYKFFAEKAREEGHEDVAKLFDEIADDEVHHAKEEVEFLGWVKSTKENLQAAIDGEIYEYTKMYPGFAEAAKSEGKDAEAARFAEIADDEKEHARRFKEALDKLK